MSTTDVARRPHRLPVDRLNEQARETTPPKSIDLSTPIDRSLHFVCPTLTPLYYTSVYEQLTPEIQRRYNQITALAFNEFTRFLEQDIGGTVLPALAETPSVPPELREYLHHFHEEEKAHAQMWTALNAHCEREWYTITESRFVRLGKLPRIALQAVLRRPRTFRWVLWILLCMEEIAMETARRTVHSAVEIEPRFLTAYQSHQQDEVRHVQVDWYLIEHLTDPLPPRRRRRDARALRYVFRHYLLAPLRVGRRVLEQLGAEYPEVRRIIPQVLNEYRALPRSVAHQSALFSRHTHPVMFALFDRYPEFQIIEDVLLTYRDDPARWAVQ